MQRTSLQGVPVLTCDAPGPLTATLHFGVGNRDEPLRLMGITHLLEHLVFAHAEPSVVHNGEVDDDATSFWAVGTPDEIVDFIRLVCAGIAALGDVSEAVLAREKKILRIEDSHGWSEFAEGLYSYRYGTSGLGKSHLGNPTVDAVTRDEIVEWARRWFTAENACLTVTGPVPAGLTLDLPAGERPVRVPEPVCGLPVRALLPSRKVGVGLSFVTASDDPELLLAVVKREINARLRLADGLIYSVDTWTSRQDDAKWHCCVALDPLPEDTAAAASAVVEVLSDLASSGPSLDAVREALGHQRVDLSFRRAVTAHLGEVAVDLVRGRTARSLEGRGERLQAPVEQVREELTLELRSALATLQVAVDDDIDPHEVAPGEGADRLTVRSLSAWDDDAVRVRGRVFRARGWSGCWTRRRMVVAADRVQVRERGETTSIAVERIVLVGERPDGELEILCCDGRRTTIDPSEWWGGRGVTARVLALCAGVERVKLPEADR